MTILTSVFGGSENTVLNAVLALAIVLVLIVLGLWGLKMLSRATSGVGRGRNRRLMVVDSLPIDTKRALHIIRRDNVEHLILTGGSQDIVIESGIAVEAVATRAVSARRPVPVVKTAARPGAPALASNPAAHRTTDSRSSPAGEPSDEANGTSLAPDVRGPLERLRDLGHPETQRRSNSLRHTGLMRPVSRMEPAFIPANTDNSDHPAPDSVRTAEVTSLHVAREDDDRRRVSGEDGTGEGYRNERS